MGLDYVNNLASTLSDTVSSTIPNNVKSNQKNNEVDNSLASSIASSQIIDIETSNTASNNKNNDLNKNNDSHKFNEKTLNKAVDTVNEKLVGSNAECKFGVHKKTGQITVKVLDKQTGDVIREIPPEKILDIVAKALEVAGILLDEKR